MHSPNSHPLRPSITRVSRLGGFLALTLIISAQLPSDVWAKTALKSSDPMPAIARPLSTKEAADKTSPTAATLNASDPLSRTLAQLVSANHITPIIQVRQARHSKIDVVSDRMHYVLFLDNDLLKQPAITNNEAALIALQLASIEPASVALNPLSASRRNLIEYRAASLMTNAKLPLASLEAVLNDAVKQPKRYADMGSATYAMSTFDTSRMVAFQRWMDDNRLQQARIASRSTGKIEGLGIAPLIPTLQSITGLQGAIEATMATPNKPINPGAPSSPIGSHETTASNFLAFTGSAPMQPSPIIQLMMSLTPTQLQLLSALREQGAVDSGQLSRAVAGMNRRQVDAEINTLVQKQLIERASGRYKLSQWASEALWFPGKATP